MSDIAVGRWPTTRVRAAGGERRDRVDRARSRCPRRTGTPGRRAPRRRCRAWRAAARPRGAGRPGRRGGCRHRGVGAVEAAGGEHAAADRREARQLHGRGQGAARHDVQGDGPAGGALGRRLRRGRRGRGRRRASPPSRRSPRRAARARRRRSRSPSSQRHRPQPGLADRRQDRRQRGDGRPPRPGRGVEVGVVQQHDLAAGQAGGGVGGDAVRAVARARQSRPQRAHSTVSQPWRRAVARAAALSTP